MGITKGREALIPGGPHITGMSSPVGGLFPGLTGVISREGLPLAPCESFSCGMLASYQGEDKTGRLEGGGLMFLQDEGKNMSCTYHPLVSVRL